MNFVKYVLIISFISNSYCQETQIDLRDKRWKAGVLTGYGFKTGLIGNKTYVYQPYIIMVEFQKKKVYFKNNLSLDYSISAEYNAVKYYNKRSDTGVTEMLDNTDIGLNFNFVLCKKISEKVDLYLILGTGPHYLHNKLTRQAKGLIFSDNLGIGSNVNINENYILDFRFVLRHLSNADLKYPNIGIENKILFVGIKKSLN
ncbi:MAG: hypothetical protein ACI9L6_000310 [Flavobacterium sp.]|jgi:hypothetical protein